LFEFPEVEEMLALELPNKFGVEFAGQNLRLLSPPRGPFSARDAYLLAAYLVTVADKVADPEQDGTFAGWIAAMALPDQSAA
jgi:hypothetical protein